MEKLALANKRRVKKQGENKAQFSPFKKMPFYFFLGNFFGPQHDKQYEFDERVGVVYYFV